MTLSLFPIGDNNNNNNNNNSYLYYCNKLFITTAEFNGLSSAIYGNGIVYFERKILAKI